MVLKESFNVELKREVTMDLKKEVVAFANSEGGKIYIGIEDDGTPIGINNLDESLLRVSNMIRDSIKPDITMYTSYNVETIIDKDVIIIEIQKGTNIPYYINDKGLRPSGVYVRQGTSSVSASDELIRQMIINSYGEKFENRRALNQDLTFNYTEKQFKNRSVEITEANMKTLSIVGIDNLYTNLGLIMSDQFKQTIKLAVFEGNDKSIFKDRREFSGSILKQLNDSYEFIDIYNKVKASYQGLYRKDTRDYPEVAIREALLNSLVHRDYSYSGSTLVNIFNDRIEFVSIGGLLPGITIDDIKLGISQSRNEKLAALFYRLKLIEAYGTGIAKIMNSYKLNSKKPELTVSDNAFLVSLPNMSVEQSIIEEDSNIEIILDYLRINSYITRKKVEKLLDIGQTMAGKILKIMVVNNLIEIKGAGPGTKYYLRNENK